MGAEAAVTGLKDDGSNRAPMWEATSFDVSHPMYTFVRTLAWYRWWLNVTAHTQIGAC